MDKKQKIQLKNKYHNHLVEIHKFVESFDIKDKNNRTIQSGYQYLADIQKNILEKYFDEKYVEDVIGVDKWMKYKELMKREQEILMEEKQMKLQSLT